MAHTHSIDCFASFLNTFPDETFVCQVFYHRLKKKITKIFTVSLEIQKWEHHQRVKKKIHRDVLILRFQSKILHVRAQSLQSCPTLCNPMDCSPSDSSVHGILQARILEWVARPSSRDYFRPRNIKPATPVLQMDSLPLRHWGSP